MNWSDQEISCLSREQTVVDDESFCAQRGDMRAFYYHSVARLQEE